MTRHIWCNKYRITQRKSSTNRLIGELNQSDGWSEYSYAYEFHELGSEDHRNPTISRLYQKVFEKITHDKFYLKTCSQTTEVVNFNLEIKLVKSLLKTYDGTSMDSFQRYMMKEIDTSKEEAEKYLTEAIAYTKKVYGRDYKPLVKGDDGFVSELTPIIFT